MCPDLHVAEHLPHANNIVKHAENKVIVSRHIDLSELSQSTLDRCAVHAFTQLLDCCFALFVQVEGCCQVRPQISCLLPFWLCILQHRNRAFCALCAQAYRLLAEEMYAKGWDYPLHLGVTEVQMSPTHPCGLCIPFRSLTHAPAFCSALSTRFLSSCQRIFGWPCR